LQRPGQLLPKEILIAELWPGVIVTDSVLTRVIRQLRKALGDDARNPRFIRTVSRVGYEFIAEVGGETDDDRLTTLAVLPFAPLVSGDRDAALELGMADSLINRLSNLRRLVVRPLSAIRHYTRLNLDPLAAGREQRVDIVIEGGLQVMREQIRMNIRVLRVFDATALLAKSFSGSFSDLEGIQESICRSVSDALEIELSQRESELLTVRATDSVSAYRCYLLGRLSSSRHTPADDRQAIEMFRRAVERDCEYALAWGALADSYVQLGTLETGAGHFETARDYAMRGLKLQSDLVPALVCLGMIAWLHDWDWTGAERYLRRALASGAGDANAHIAYSDFCCYQRRYREGIDAATRALELDPNSAWVNALLAQALHMAGLHNEAIAQARQALDTAPDFAFAHLFAGLSCMMSRKYSQGIAHLEQARRHSSRNDFAAALAWAYGLAGRRDDALEIRRDLETDGKGTPPMVLSMAYLGLGDEEQTLDLVEQAAEEGDWRVLLLYSEPIFQHLRRLPRAVKLLSRLRLFS
jgi:TolB-like protein/Flp pilus assembly protein TadD